MGIANSPSSLVAAAVMSGVVAYALGGHTGLLKAGQSEAFAAAPPASASAQQSFFVPGGRFVVADMYYQPVLLADRLGLFAFSRGVVARYDPAGLALVKSVELFGPAPKIPEEGFASRDDANAYSLAAILRTLPAAMIATDKDLLIVVNDAAYCRYFRLNKETLAVETDATLTREPQGGWNPSAFRWGLARPPLLAVEGSTLYICSLAQSSFGFQQRPAISAVDIATGKPLAGADLPAQLLPRKWKPIEGGPSIANLYLAFQKPSVVLTATPQALFLYQDGAVAKFGLTQKLLNLEGVAELFGPVPSPAPDSPKEEKEAAMFDRARRMLPAAVIHQGNDLLIISGDRFFRLDTANMTVAASGSAEPPDPAKAKARMEQLMAVGEPAAAVAGQSLSVTRGGEVVLFNLADGKLLAQKRLPEPMNRRLLDFPMPAPPALAQTQPPPVPTEGQQVSLNGFIEKRASPAGPFWTLHDGMFRADFVITGDAFTKLLADHPDDIEEQPVAVVGTYHAKEDGVPEFGKGVVDSTMAFQVPVFAMGTLAGHVGPKGKFWTIKMITATGGLPDGEYVLVGNKARDLAVQPGAEGAQVTITGKLKKSYPGFAPFGKGFIELSTFQLNRPPSDDLAP